jgi:hypothetical protein
MIPDVDAVAPDDDAGAAPAEVLEVGERVEVMLAVAALEIGKAGGHGFARLLGCVNVGAGPPAGNARREYRSRCRARL